MFAGSSKGKQTNGSKCTQDQSQTVEAYGLDLISAISRFPVLDWYTHPSPAMNVGDKSPILWKNCPWLKGAT